MDPTSGTEFKRISTEQRELMIDFMERHPAIGTGRFTAPDGAKQKQRQLKELADILNSVADGATKTPDKWLKSWQDWRSDTKTKAALLKKEVNKTGGGRISQKAKPPMPLEERLLAFLGATAVFGHVRVEDLMTAGTSQSSQEVVVVDEDTIMLPLEPSADVIASTSSTPEIISVPFLSPQIPSPPPASPTPSASGTVATDDSSRTSPWRQSTRVGTGGQGVKRRRPTASSVSDAGADEGARLIALTERQIQIAEEGLQYQQRQTIANERQTEIMESAAVAFCSAMRALEEYLQRRTD